MKKNNDWIEISWCGEDSLNGFQFDYSPSKGVIRVSYFEDGHFVDEGFTDIELITDFKYGDDLK